MQQKYLYLLYVKGVSEKIEIDQLGIRAVFKLHNTLRQALMKVKNNRLEELPTYLLYNNLS